MSEPAQVMTRKQAAFIRILALEALGEEGSREYLDALRREHPNPTVDQAAEWITDLKSRKSKDSAAATSHDGKLPDVKAGRYAVPDEDGNLRLYRVDRPLRGRFSGYVFVKSLPEDETVDVERNLPFPKAQAILQKIAPDIKGASVAYGRKTGICGICGRQLTDTASIEAGIGPVCAAK